MPLPSWKRGRSKDMKTIKFGGVLLALLLAAIVIVPMVNAADEDDNEYYKDMLITSFGPLHCDIQNKIVTTENTLTKEYTSSDETFSLLEKVTEDASSDLDKYYYPNGPVIGHGYDLYGTMYVQLNKEWNVNQSLITEIYQVIKKNGEKNGIKNIPCKFLSMSIPKVEAGRSDKIRPLMGGTKITVTDGTWGTLGFKAKDSNNNVGFVTVAHLGPLGSMFYQPDPSVSGSYVGSSTILAITQSDSAFIPYSDTGNKVFLNSDTEYLVYSSYGDPSLGETARVTEAASGRFMGKIVMKGVATNTHYNIQLPNQYYAKYSSADGDSGAPVYTRTGSSSNYIYKLAGMHWGRTDTYAVFTGISGIQSDLGITPLI